MTVVHGAHDPRFRPVRETFEANFADGGEAGAAVAIVLDGENGARPLCGNPRRRR